MGEQTPLIESESFLISVREFLSSYSECDSIIETINNAIEREMDVGDLPSYNYERIRVQTSGKAERIEDRYIGRLDLIERLKLEREEAEQRKILIVKIISKLPDLKHRIALSSIYINRMTYADTAAILNHSVRWTTRIIRASVKEFGKKCIELGIYDDVNHKWVIGVDVWE